ncbi:MAG TPA: phosphoribosylpyrophosphate synthetase [Flavobacteriaceae bacterium]|nr:phosphoribosylpyrophosphate synthetase [Flavobacteriaceae bacterium]
MAIPKAYDTVTEAMQDLTKRGYTAHFLSDENKQCLICNSSKIELSPDVFKIDELYRFEGMTDPGDEMILLAISSKKYNIKGMVLNAFGIYSDTLKARITEKL